MNGHLKSCSPNGTPRISIQPIQKSHAFNDPGQIQNDEKNSTWNTFNKYPWWQIKKFFTKKLIEMDEFAVKQLLNRINVEETINELQREQMQLNRMDLREKLRMRHEATIDL